MKIKPIWRVVLFTLIIILLLGLLGELFRPLWYYRTFDSFYDQPKNTIETIFLGASIVSAGIIPTELYNEYGICAFNFATAKQPILESYYWLEETYRLHPETLKTIMLDVSSLRAFDEIKLGLTIDKMKFSSVKLRAVWDYTEHDITATFDALVPLIAHHSLWTDTTLEDFRRYELDGNEGMRGYYYEDKTITDSNDFDKITVRKTTLKKDAKPAKLNERSLEYFSKMIEFCNEKEIELVLFKTPAYGWTSALHNAVNELAEEHSLIFLDYNFAPLCEEIQYIYPYDHQDATHLNFYGAQKLTTHIGKFLTEYCGATDVRGKEGFEHMEDEASEFALRATQVARLHETSDIAEYISCAIEKDNTVFLSVRGDVTPFLSDDLRGMLRQLGLEQLAQIDSDDTYVGVLNSNGTVSEKLSKSGEPIAELTGELEDKTRFYLSGGENSSCKLDYDEQPENKEGINIVVYSNELGCTVDTEVFDTAKTAERFTYNLTISEQYFSDPQANYPEGSILENIRRYLSAVKHASGK